MKNSRIEWTDHTVNPWWGCIKVSDGCKHCYAEDLTAYHDEWIRLAYRMERGEKMKLWGPGSRRPVRIDPAIAELAGHAADKSLGRPPRVFIPSMGDLFEELKEEHEDYWAVDDARRRLFAYIAAEPRLRYQLLTKRPENIERMVPPTWLNDWPEHVWIGASVETPEYLHRLDDLRALPASTRFVSVEPLLGTDTNFEFEGIQWVLIGGESGSDRPFHIETGLAVVEAAKRAGAKVFFKQLGSNPRFGGEPYSHPDEPASEKRTHRTNPDYWPEACRIREFPDEEVGEAPSQAA